MNLGWIRASYGIAPGLSLEDIAAIARQADDLGIGQIWFPELTLDELEKMPVPDRLQLGVDLGASAHSPANDLKDKIRAGQDKFGDKFIVGLHQGKEKADRVAMERIETLFSDDPCQLISSDMPFAPPRPTVMVRTAPKSEPDLWRGAGAGFDVVSPAWQGGSELARHWSDVVAGATFARRRARPSQWHLARLIYVTDDQDEVADYLKGPAQRYLKAMMVDPAAADAPNLVIAGTSDHVASKLSELRKRLGPFGTLHVLDPGLPLNAIERQMECITKLVLPQMSEIDTLRQTRELEKT